MDKLIITAAIQGAELTLDQFPYLPIRVEQVAQEAYKAWNEGAAIIHLHVRDKNGKPTQSADVFKEHIEAIKATGCKSIIQVSTGGAVGMSAEERLQPLTLKPEFASLSTGSVNFGDDLFSNPPSYLEKFAMSMQSYGVRPEFEIFEEGFVNNAMRLVKKGLVTGHLHFDFVLGVAGGMTASPKNLILLVEKIPGDATWTVAGMGPNQLTLGTMAIHMGGNVRVGFEDNIYYSKGVLAKSNGELVARIVRIAKEFNRDIASPDEARKILGIKGLT